MRFLGLKFRYVLLMVWGTGYSERDVVEFGKNWHDSEIKANAEAVEALKKPRDVIDSSYLVFVVEKCVNFENIIEEVI